MNVNDVRTSRYLKKEDVGIGTLVTIDHLTQENIAKDGADPDVKIVVHFVELDKPMVLNSTNAQIIAKIAGSDVNIEATWIGTRVVLYSDPNVQYAGKLVGGLRVRAPKPSAVKSAIPPAPDPLANDGLPF